MATEEKIESLLASQDSSNIQLAIQLINSTLSQPLETFLGSRTLKFKPLDWGDEADFYTRLLFGKINIYYELRTTYQPYVGTSKILKRQYILNQEDSEHYPVSMQWKKCVKHLKSSSEIQHLVRQDYLSIIPIIAQALID